MVEQEQSKQHKLKHYFESVRSRASAIAHSERVGAVVLAAIALGFAWGVVTVIHDYELSQNPQIPPTEGLFSGFDPTCAQPQTAEESFFVNQGSQIKRIEGRKVLVNDLGQTVVTWVEYEGRLGSRLPVDKQHILLIDEPFSWQSLDNDIVYTATLKPMGRVITQVSCPKLSQ